MPPRVCLLSICCRSKDVDAFERGYLPVDVVVELTAWGTPILLKPSLNVIVVVHQ